jgi:arylsulfatase A-like enzyme
VGPDAADTPNVQRFADRTWRFDQHFMGSLPCLSARRELFAGFQEMMWRHWGPLESFDARLPRLVERGGYSTGLVTDQYHYWEEPGNGYLQSFHSTELIRGHESDNWHLPRGVDASTPEWVRSIERWRPGAGARQYYGNVHDFRDEQDFFTAKVMHVGAEWLRAHAHRRPFFFQVETFDVHEPFHVPGPYRSMYWSGDAPEKFTVWPPHQDPAQEAAFVDATTPQELAFIRTQYRGKIKMMDNWFGVLLAAFDEQRIWDDTVVIVTTDHGHDLRERDGFGKQYPHYDSHAQIPMLVWHPDHPHGGVVSSLTTTVDLFPTILETAGQPIPPHTHGRSFLPLLRGDTSDARHAVLYGPFGQGLCVTDGEWTLFKSPVGEGPLHYYSVGIFRSLHVEGRNRPAGQGCFIPDVDLPQWKVPVRSAPRTRENFLYHRPEDPGKHRNLWNDAPHPRQHMLSPMKQLADAQGAPVEQYERLGLVRV